MGKVNLPPGVPVSLWSLGPPVIQVVTLYYCDRANYTYSMMLLVPVLYQNLKSL